MDNAISIDSLKKEYKQFLLDSISFDVPRGYITGFIGPNGSGKTTTIKSILSYIRPDGGIIKVLDEEVAEDNTYLEKIGVVMDTPFLVKDWTIKDVEKSIKPFYTKWNSETFHMYLTKFKIHETLKVKELSRGMTVKLMIAIALSHGAELLVLDEPTSGLDPVAREEICEILQEFVEDEKHSVFFSTHITSDLEEIADYIIFLINGKIVYKGEKDNLMENYILIKGGIKELESLDQNKLIGIRKHATGFEAVSLKADSINLRDDFIIEPISLEKLIIFFNRGELR